MSCISQKLLHRITSADAWRYTIGRPQFWSNLLILASVLSLTIAYLSMRDEDF